MAAPARVFNGSWSVADQTAGGCVRYPTVGDNPQWFLTVNAACTVTLELEQLLPDGGSAKNANIAVLVCYKNGERIKLIFQGDKVGSSEPYRNSTTASCSVFLEPREAPFTVIATTFEPGVELDFKLTVSSDAGFSMEAAETPAEKLARLSHRERGEGAWAGRTAGGSINFETFERNPQFFIDVAQETSAVIRMTQAPPPSGDLFQIAFYIVRAEGGRAEQVYEEDLVAMSGTYVNSQVIEADAVLPASDKAYTLIPSTFNPNQETTFFIEILTDNPVGLRKAPEYGETVSLADNVGSAYAKRREGASYLMGCTHRPPVEPSARLLAIREGCESTGSAWTDPDFTPAADWKRLVEMKVKPLADGRVPTPILFDSIDPDDIEQGTLGDCWFLSGMSATAARDQAITDLYVEDDTNPLGFYACWFYDAVRGWEEVIVDDTVPMRPNGRPLYASSDEPHEMWTSIMEKCYAKWQGGYDKIEGGHSHHAFVNLTGGVSEMIKWTPGSSASVSVDALWETLLVYYSREYMLACGSVGGSDDSANSAGIVDGHAYTILQVREYNGNQLLHIRNPHGGNEWTGAWSDGDTVNWTAQAKADLGHRDEDDGEFWISVGDFYANYRTCYVCKVFPASKWVQTTVTGTLTRGGPSGVSNQYRLRVPGNVHAVISVRQTERRATGATPPPVNFHLVRNGGAAVASYSGTNEVFQAGLFERGEEKAWEGDIDAYENEYTLVIRTMNEGEASWPFALRIFTEGAVPIEICDMDGNVVSTVSSTEAPVAAVSQATADAGATTSGVGADDAPGPSEQTTKRRERTGYVNPGLADAGEAETSDMPYSFEFRDEWSVSQRTAGGSSNYDTVGDNPQWLLAVLDAETTIHFELEQLGAETTPAAVIVADKGGDRMDLFLERERAASSEPYIDDRVISFAATLPPLPHPYTVFCTAFEPGVEGLFRLTAKSADTFRMEEAPAPVDEKSSFAHKIAVESEWKGATAGGCVNFDSFADNPQFYLRVPNGANTLIEVTQDLASGMVPIGVCVVDKGSETKVDVVYENEQVAASEAFTNTASMSLTAFLGAKEYPYVVVPSTFNPGDESKFTLTVYSDQPVQLEFAR